MGDWRPTSDGPALFDQSPPNNGSAPVADRSPLSDRSAVLLAELQAVCQRILASEPRMPGGTVGLVSLASVANGTAVANSLEALRRQCVDNYHQVAELKRSVDVHRGVVATDSATNARLLVEMTRSVEALVAVVERDRAERHDQLDGLAQSVESLRVGLAGFGAGSRQQASAMRDAVAALEGAVTTFGEQVGTALDGLAGQIQSALASLAGQVSDALQETGDQVGREMERQSATHEALLSKLDGPGTRDRLDELEALLSEGLPKFSEDIQAGVQQSLLSVSRTFELSEREHGNRMVDLHRDFDRTIRRLEATLEPRRRDGTDRRRDNRRDNRSDGHTAGGTDDRGTDDRATDDRATDGRTAGGTDDRGTDG
jgi:hypothetical protein